MSNSTYNGWTNYATWRVHLEMFDCQYNCESFNFNQNQYELSLDIRSYAEDMITESSTEGLARDYAAAFLSDVNWYEIAEKMIETYKEESEEA